MSFRNAVFKLCQDMEKSKSAQEVASVMKKISLIKEDENSVINTNPYGNFDYIAKHSRNQFHGYLFLDENLDKIALPKSMIAKHLTKNDRNIIEKGYLTILKFVSFCLRDIQKKYPMVAESISPYFLYKEVDYNKNIELILSEEKLLVAANEFKKNKVYKKVVTSEIGNIIEDMDIDLLRELIDTFDKEIVEAELDNESEHLKKFSMKLSDEIYKIEDYLTAYIILICSLRKSLTIACQMLYKSICGGNLVVLDNDNLISIDARNHNFICNKYKVIAQDIFFDVIGDLLVIDCEDYSGSNIKDFGYVIQGTMKFSDETGYITKLSFVVVDHFLNPIKNITDKVINLDF